jgi:hypothetical protein
MAIVEVTKGGVEFWCITSSETPTFRMFWDSVGVVQDLFQSTEESLTLAVNNAFEGADRDECISKIDELGLYFDPIVET